MSEVALISVCAELSPADLQVCWAGGRRAFTANLLAAVDPVRVPEACLRRTSIYALTDVKRADITARWAYHTQRPFRGRYR